MKQWNSAARRIRRAAVAVLSSVLLALPLLSPGGAYSAEEDIRSEQWWLSGLRVEEIWEQTTGEGVVVAVVDDGVEPVGDLDGALLPGFTSNGGGRGDQGDSDDQHGTGMATLIAGRGTGAGVMGVAPGAAILPVKLPTDFTADDTARALTRLAEMDDPPEVVNMSISSPGRCSTREQEAVRRAVDRGMILVAAVGNDHHEGRDTPDSPASCAGVIAVGAIGWAGNHDDGTPDVFLWESSEHHPYTAFAAPGVRMVQFRPGFGRGYPSGTSDAAAVASGSFALIRAAFPDLSARDVVARAMATARHYDGSTAQGERNEGWGFGVLRPWGAIFEDVPADSPNPIYDELDRVVPPTAAPSGEESALGGGSDPGTGTAGESERAAPDSDGGASGTVLALALGGGIAVVVVIAAVFLMVRRRSGAAGGGA